MSKEFIKLIAIHFCLVVLGSKGFYSPNVTKDLLVKLRNLSRGISDVFHDGSDILTGALSVNEKREHNP